MCVNYFITATAAVMLYFFCGFPKSLAEKTACQRLNEAYSHSKDGHIRSNSSVFIYGKERQVTVYWDGRETSRAAAALLSVLVRHGLRYQRVILKRNYTLLCEHAHFMMQNNCADYDQSNNIFNDLWLIPAISYEEGYCMNMEICLKREVVPLRLQIDGGAAPLRLRIHAVLMDTVRNIPRCRNASSWDFYTNRNALVECGFSSNNESNVCATFWYATSEPGSKKTVNALKERINIYSLQHNFSFLPLRSYKELHHNIHNVLQSHNFSVLFLDYDIWENVPDVLLVQPPPTSGRNQKNELDHIRALRAADVPILQQFAPHLLKVFEQFSPKPTQLREVIELEMKLPTSDMEEAACEWAIQNSITFESWYDIIFRRQHWIAVFLCDKDQDKNNYIRTAWKIVDFFKTKIKLDVSIFFVEVDCSSESELTNKFIKTTMSNRWPYLIGAIAAGEGAKMAAEYAPQIETTLVLYDVPTSGVRLGPAVHTAGGNLNQLVTAMKHFILSHKWRRLAILSEETQLANDYVEALQHEENLVVRNININASTRLKDTLHSLKTASARIFFLNSNSSVSRIILCFAQELEMTSYYGYVWILREWRPSSLKCADSYNLSQTSHYTISYWWQGHKDVELFLSNYTMKTNNSFANMLNDSQYFLPLTIPMADAIQILFRKFYLFFNHFSSRKNDIHGEGTLSLLMKSFEEQYFDGVLQELNYIDGSLASASVFITQWNGVNSTSLTRWSIFKGEIKVIDEGVAIFYKDSIPLDGSSNCLTFTVGDPFNPHCQDYLWLTYLISVLVLVSLLCYSCRKRVRNLTHRDSILRAQLLAKHEVLLSNLVDHFIDRGALELNHDIGQGNFGRVRHGVLRATGRFPMIVAVKELHEDCTPAEESELLREAVTLAAIQHPHVVRLIGVCTTDGPLLVLLEYAFFGNLRDYLYERRPLIEISLDSSDVRDEVFQVSAESLTRLAREAVSALEYLSIQRLVHRDIRATNCLVNEQRSLKLADFGLARTTGVGVDEEYWCQRRGLFPVRWMAPESLQLGVFTTATDVWALGVLLLELSTLGARPYGSWPLNRVMDYVCTGGHPPIPSNILPEMREVFLRCWQHQPERRSTVTEIAVALEQNPNILTPALGPTDPILEEEYATSYDDVFDS